MNKEIIQKIYNIHDVDCNQKYDKTLPYSFHLENVRKIALTYSDCILWGIKALPEREFEWATIELSAVGHALIEDARLTYNDVVQLLQTRMCVNRVADIIYDCTEEKGKTRSERHNSKFYIELSKNRLAVYIKLCDILSNILYSKLTCSIMFEQYKKEYATVEDYLYKEGEYDVLWKRIERELSIK